ncbi:MAG: IS3 family transposase [Actinobacteria bacterium]|nr:IS3 family transposase [Actinomycetota bacterium]
MGVRPACAPPACSGPCDPLATRTTTPWLRASSPPLQRELLDEHRWQTRRQLALAVFEWIEAWYNPRRRHSSIGGLSPIDYGARFSCRFSTLLPTRLGKEALTRFFATWTISFPNSSGVLTEGEDFGRRAHSPLEWWQWLIIAVIVGVVIAVVIAVPDLGWLRVDSCRVFRYMCVRIGSLGRAMSRVAFLK